MSQGMMRIIESKLGANVCYRTGLNDVVLSQIVIYGPVVGGHDADNSGAHIADSQDRSV